MKYSSRQKSLIQRMHVRLMCRRLVTSSLGSVSHETWTFYLKPLCLWDDLTCWWLMSHLNLLQCNWPCKQFPLSKTSPFHTSCSNTRRSSRVCRTECVLMAFVPFTTIACISAWFLRLWFSFIMFTSLSVAVENSSLASLVRTFRYCFF